QKILNLVSGADAHDFSHRETPLALKRRIVRLSAKAVGPRSDVLRRLEFMSSKLNVEVIARCRSQHVFHAIDVGESDLALFIQRRAFAEAFETLLVSLEHHRKSDQMRKRMKVIEPREISR